MANRRALASALDAVAVAGCVRLADWFDLQGLDDLPVPVEALVDRLGLGDRVILGGGRDDVPDLLARSAVFVLSSKSEGLPISVIEAMAAGLPVVASQVGGVGELVVDGETGLLVSPGDPQALAGALARLLDEAPLRRALGGAGRRRAQAEFDLHAFREAHLRLLREELART